MEAAGEEIPPVYGLHPTQLTKSNRLQEMFGSNPQRPPPSGNSSPKNSDQEGRNPHQNLPRQPMKVPIMVILILEVHLRTQTHLILKEGAV